MPYRQEFSLKAPSPPSWLSRLRDSLRSITLGPYNSKDKALANLFDGPPNAAGIAVNERTAFTFSAVFDAVNQISSDVAKLPLNLHKRRKDGGSDLYTDSKLYRLLKYEPNPEMGSMVFRRTLMAHALTCKGAFAEIERDVQNKPIALWPLTPDRVTPERDTVRGMDGRMRLGPVRYRIDNSKVTIPAEDMLHIHGLGYDGTIGYSVVEQARQAIGLGLAAERFGASFFGNGSTFGGVFTTDAEDVDEEGFRASIKNLHQGPDRAHQFLLLHGGTWKYEKLGVTPNDSQMDELRNKQVEEVARFFNMPLHKLKNLTRSTNNNIEQQDLEYYKGCLLTWITLWEEELNRKLIAPLEAKQQYIKHNANAFLRGDIKSRYEALGIARDKGIINADEWRDLEEMNPQPDGQGKTYLVPLTHGPADRIYDVVDSQIKKNETPAAPPPASDATKTREEVEAATARAERAEALAIEARADADSARAIAIAIEATGTANAEEVALRRQTEAEMTAKATQFEVLATELRAHVERLKSESDAASQEADQRFTAATSALEQAERAAHEAQTLAATVEAERARLASELVLANERETKAFHEMEAAVASATAAAALVATSDAEQARKEAARVDAEATAHRAIEALDAARAELARVELDATAAYGAAVSAQAESDRQIAALQAQCTATEQARQQLEADCAAASAQTLQVTAERDGLATRLEATTVHVTTSEAARQAHRQTELTRLTNVVAAHRGLIVDAVGRMTRREAEKARRHQATPEKLRNWLTTFDALHAEMCVEALLPAMRTHLAWKGSDEDAHTVTTALVQAHLVTFTDRLRAVADTDLSEYHGLLTHTLERWERDQPEQMADQVMRDALAYLQAYDRQERTS